jgi:hypothetical protein
MHNNRRRFVAAGAAGLTTLLVPNVAEACFCRRCRRAAAEPGTLYVVRPLPSAHVNCAFWSPSIAPPSGSLTKGTAYTFGAQGYGLYNAFIGGEGLGAGTFCPSITDTDNPATVRWGSYSVQGVSNATGTSGQDVLTFKAIYMLVGSVQPTSGTLAITCSISSPYVGCGLYPFNPVSVAYS